ncbi:hypothetical protein PX699_21255 [Sphingobium sp. H39-3-25]|uniref:hypothetical protein n=1 Tax=Sphingobium arseniciresistens TaxID=3030834 RepID=UPI0023B89F34|nr:hypothetical protein [Sphingobium arseniciresistens]
MTYVFDASSAGVAGLSQDLCDNPDIDRPRPTSLYGTLLNRAGTFCSDWCDVLVACEAAQSLQPGIVIVGVDEELELPPQFALSTMMVASLMAPFVRSAYPLAW